MENKYDLLYIKSIQVCTFTTVIRGIHRMELYENNHTMFCLHYLLRCTETWCNINGSHEIYIYIYIYNMHICDLRLFIEDPNIYFTVPAYEDLKPRDWYFKLSYRFEIWQAHRQQCCRSACQISEWSDNSEYKSRGFETSRDLTIRRLFGYWDGAQVSRAGTGLVITSHRYCYYICFWHSRPLRAQWAHQTDDAG